MKKLLITFLACVVAVAYVTAEDNSDGVPDDQSEMIEENVDDRSEMIEENVDDRSEMIEENVDDRREMIDGCLRPGAIATGQHIRTGSLRVNSAKKCQDLCAANDDCNYFRWRGRDLKAKWRLRRRCYLMKEMKDVKKRIQWTWGPKEC